MSGRMWRVVAVFRVITLSYVALLILRADSRYGHPVGGLIALAFMAGWTIVTVVAYARPSGRQPWLIVTDVAVSAGLILSTRLIDTTARINGGAPTIPGIWACSAVLACAVAGGPWVGLAGAVAVSAADLAERDAFLPQTTFTNTVIVLIAGGVGGYVVRLALQTEEAVDRAARAEAAVAERERIARGIHDSVLQVLALVSSRGRMLGGEAAELGRLASEQESALRALVSGTMTEPDAETGQIDVRGLIEPLASASITVSCPATPVLLPVLAARAVGGAARAAVDNIGRHAGDGAHGWVLVEDEGATIRVSVRDDGPGFANGRLLDAAAAGRLGVSQSIIGRMRDVGGVATVTSAPGQGTEVDVRVPR
jgi:signal transduction histidine kinase